MCRKCKGFKGLTVTGKSVMDVMSRAVCIAAVVISVCVMASGDGYAGPIFSSNGLGIQVRDDAGRARAMGGAGVADVNGGNLINGNPALLSTIGAHTYSFGALHERSTAFTGGSDQPEFAKTLADNFDLVLPLAKGFAFGWSLSPLTRTESIIRYTAPEYEDEVEFTGGINSSSLGLSSKISDYGYIGISMNYYFGMIEETWYRRFPGDELYDSYDSIKKKYKGYGLSVGAIARVWKQTTVGFGFSPKTDLDATVRVRPGSYSSPEHVLKTTTTTLPSRWRFGVSSIIKKTFVINADYSMESWEDAAKTAREKRMYNDTYTFAAGVRFNPSRSLNASLWRKIPVSAGFRMGTLYYKSYPKVDTVTEKSVTVGFEIPFKEDRASLVASYELGIRGDKSKNGWEENFSNIGLTLIGRIK